MAQTITVDTTPGFRMPTIYFSQGDIGRTFDINLASRFGDSLPASPTIKIMATKPSGFGFTVTASTVSGSVATFATTAEMTDEAGRYPAEIEISKSGTVLYTANFAIMCEENTHPEGTTDGQAEQVIPELTLLVERAETAANLLLNCSAEATTLSAGSSATAVYDDETGKFTFGIPQGEAGAGAAGVTASAYSSSNTYAVGDYVIHNSNLYRCTTAITTAESFTAAHWTQVVLADDVSDLKSDINYLSENPIEDVPTLTASKYINRSGVETAGGASLAVSDFIMIPQNTYKFDVTKYPANISSLMYGVNFYDSNKTWISGIDYLGEYTVLASQIPSNAVYVRLGDYDTQSTPTHDQVTISFYVHLLNDKVDKIGADWNNTKTYELSQEPTLTTKAYVNRSGVLTTSTDAKLYRSDFIKIPQGCISILVENVAPLRSALIQYGVYYFDAHKSPISGVDNYKINAEDIPIGTEYIIISGYEEIDNSTPSVTFYCGSLNERIKEFESAFEYRSKDILVDKSSVDYYSANTSGANAGDLASNANFFTSMYIDVEPETTYSVNAGDPYIASDVGNICFYDEGKRFISRQASVWKQFTTPADAKYCRISVYYDTFANTSFNGIYITKGDVPKPINTNPYLKSNLDGKKWTVIGDSITDFNFRSAINYHQYVAADLGLEVVNAGVSGSGYKQHEGQGGLYDAFYLRVLEEDDGEYVMDLDADLITIFGGVNDVIFGNPIGVYTDTATDTVCGCVNKTIDNIMTRMTDKYIPLGIISPLPCDYQGVATYPTQLPTDEDCEMQTFVAELEKICKVRGIPFLDLFHQSNFNPSNATFRSTYTSCHGTTAGDGLHPNQYGHKLFYRQIEEFVKAIIR